LHNIAMAQGDPAYPPVAPKHAIGGFKVLEYPVPILWPVLLHEGMDSAHALGISGELTTLITANAHPICAEFHPACELFPLP
jgi:hypothetical protein